MFKFSKKFISLSLSTILLACLVPNVLAQSSSKNLATNNKNQSKLANDKPWLITVIHEVNLSEIQKSLLQQGFKMDISNDKLINFKPINITTGIVLDNQGHILTRLVNLNPEAGKQGIGSITVLLPSGEERQARFVGLDGPSGFSILSVENLGIEPAQLANPNPISSNVPVTILNVQFSDRLSIRQNLDKLERIRQLSRNFLSQSTRVIQFFNKGFFSVSFSNNTQNESSLSFGVVLNKNKEVIGIPETVQNNQIQVFSASEARRAANRIIARQGNVPRAWLGVRGVDVSRLNSNQLIELGITKPNGVYITNIIPESPAETFGLREKDVIITVNNEPIESESHLFSFIALQPAGETLEIGVLRRKQKQFFRLTLGERGYDSPFVLDKIEAQANMYFLQEKLKSVDTALADFRDEFSKIKETQPDLNPSDPSLEDTLKNIQEFERQRGFLMIQLRNNFFRNNQEDDITQNFLGVKVEDLPEPPPNPDVTKPQRFPHGVKVTEMLPNSLAEKTGVKVGDILVKITYFAIDTKDNLKAILPLVKGSSGLGVNTLVITRNGQEITLPLALPKKLPKVNVGNNEVLTEELRKKLEDEKLNLLEEKEHQD